MHINFAGRHVDRVVSYYVIARCLESFLDSEAAKLGGIPVFIGCLLC